MKIKLIQNSQTTVLDLARGDFFMHKGDVYRKLENSIHYTYPSGGTAALDSMRMKRGGCVSIGMDTIITRINCELVQV